MLTNFEKIIQNIMEMDVFEIVCLSALSLAAILLIVVFIANMFNGKKAIKPLTYESLPKNIKEKLFKVHQHGDAVDDKEIVYKESDVIDIINYLIN